MSDDTQCILIRNLETEEGVGICKIPAAPRWVWRVYHPRYPDNTTTIHLIKITEVEYSTYQALNLFPVYEVIATLEGEEGHHVDVFDPNHFFYHETPQKREILRFT